MEKQVQIFRHGFGWTMTFVDQKHLNGYSCPPHPDDFRALSSKLVDRI